MNDTDSKHIQAELEKHKGYSATQNIEDADLIIINTCSVREKPVQKLFSEIGQFNKKKKDGAKIGVCGCTASHLGEDIIKRAPYVDFVLGARNISKIKDVVDKKGSVEISIDNDDSQYEFAIANNNNFRTSVNISVGCDKECTYCIVPSTRGDEISIPPQMIVSQIQKAVDNGVVEVALLGQNVNSYGKRFSNNADKYSFTQLLQDISKIDGLKRIRFTSPHPLHMDDDFIEEFARNPKISKCIHMPLQSGSTKILKAMKRGYTKEWFLNRAFKMRELIPDLRITTDIIVAFPGETHEDFLDTLDVVKKVGFDNSFMFMYSIRKGTKAADMDGQIDEEVKKSRLQRLIELQNEMSKSANAPFIGRVEKVLVEGESRKNKEMLTGRTSTNKVVIFKGDISLAGQFVNVKINDFKTWTLYGDII